MLVFTQYRTTQIYLRDQLQHQFPGCGVEIINGDIELEDRREARRRFEGVSRFMVSTEAGGEGVNLQKACHVMINYDLAWNPMRLQQRIGRLDRYRQKEIVQVFNLRVMNSWDNRISLRILERLGSIQRTMGMVTSEIEDYQDMILGAIATQIDETQLFLASHGNSQTEPNDKQVDAWIQNALGSVKRWEKVFNLGLGMPEGKTPTRSRLTSDDFRQAFAVALEQHGIRLMETRTQDSKFVEGVFHFQLPKAFKDPILRPSPEVYLTFDRAIFSETRGQVLGHARGQAIKPILAGFGEPVTDWLFETAFAAAEGESGFAVRVDEHWQHGNGWLAIAALRWMGQSRRLKAPDTLVACLQNSAGEWCILSPTEVMHFIKCSQAAQTPTVNEVTNLDQPRALVQTELRRKLENREPATRALASWSWLAVVRIDS